MGWWLFALVGFAPVHAADKGDITLSVGTAGLADSGPSVGVLGSSMVGFAVSDRLQILVGGREGIASGEGRIIGSVHIGVAHELGEHWFVRGGFAHHHETPLEAAAADPWGTLIGAADGIRHRSGADLGLGHVWTLPAVSTSGVHYSVWLSAIAFPDTKGSQLYGVLEHQVTLDFGKKAVKEG